MKDVKFIRINEDNINFIPDIIKIDDKDIQKKIQKNSLLIVIITVSQEFVKMKLLHFYMVMEC